METPITREYTPVALTMEELASLTHQKLFDMCATHLFNQGLRSMQLGAEDNCAYRGVDGAMCAAGIFIPDSVYHPDMDAKSTCVDVVLNGTPKYGVVMRPYEALLRQLQGNHDDGYNWKSTEAMRQKLADSAEFLGLDDSILRTLSFADR